MAVLEIYLYLHPPARETIFRYVRESKVKRLGDDAELGSGDELIRLSASSYARAASRSDRDKELAKALFLMLTQAKWDI